MTAAPGQPAAPDPDPQGAPSEADLRARHARRERSRLATRQVWAARATALLVALGAALRLRQWLGDRSLWLDEALIARSLVERGHLALATEPLLHNQAAPQGWLQATRLAVEVFGDGERSLRLVSLLAGLATLGLVWALAQRLLPAVLVPVAVGLTALSPDLVYYANEVKPYALDVAVVLLVLLVAMLDRPRVLGLVGAVAVWTAYPSVFALAGASVLLVLRRPSWPERLRAARELSPWVVSLAAAYALVLAPLQGREVYALYWAYAYPRGADDLPRWLLERGGDLADDPLGLWWAPLAGVLLLVGTARLLRRDVPRTALLLAPVPLAVLAGGLSVYPLADRLVLWLVPVVAIVLAGALDRDDGRRAVVVAVLLALTAGPAVVRSLPLAVHTQEVEELRPVLEQVAARRRPGDLVLVDIAAKGAFDFYAPRLGVPRDGVVLFRTPPAGTSCGDDLVALRTGRFGNGRVWLVFSHELVEGDVLGSRADLLGRIGRVTRLGASIEQTGAAALLLSPARGGQDIPPAPLTERRCLVVNRSAR